MTTKTANDDSIDFDAYTQDDLANDIQQAGRKLGNRYVFKWPYLHIKTYQGHQYRLPLDLKPDALNGIDDKAAPAEQMRQLLAEHNPGKKKQIDGELAVSMIDLSYEYWQVFEQVQAATLGKYVDSSEPSDETVTASAPTSPDVGGASPQTLADD